MPLDLKTGQTVNVTVNRKINRASALKTLERLFMKDKAIFQPLNVRSKNFKELPKRRGGQIWTKRPNKLHPSLERASRRQSEDHATGDQGPEQRRDVCRCESGVISVLGPA